MRWIEYDKGDTMLNLDYVYQSKREPIQELYDSFKMIDSENAPVYKNATILPAVQYYDYDVSHGRGGVVDSSGNYIEESKTRARVVGKYEFVDAEYVDEKVVFCGFFQKAWGHYITEVISRLWYSLKHDNSIDSYVFIVEKDAERFFTGNYSELLRLLGIVDKVKVINKPTTFSQVVIPEHGFVYRDHFTEQYVKMFDFIIKKALEEYNGPKYDRVYFSKSKLPTNVRANLNFKMIDRFFAKNGFVTFYPENLSLVDTIGVLQNASIFASVTSSPAHNLVFGKENQTMISLEKQAFLNPYQIFISKFKNSNTVFIDAFRFIFPIETAGPFIFDYTKFLAKYVKDNSWTPEKRMSKAKFRKIYKKYMQHYFALNVEMPPDYLYRQYNLNAMREAYADMIENYYQVLKPSVYQRIKVRIKKELLSRFNIEIE